MHLVPAYGRDYPSKKAVLAAWEANHDFLISDISSPYDGKPVNREQAPTGTHNIRYKRLTQVCVVKK